MSFVKRQRKYYKDVYQDWTQPVLTANGELGGTSFACFVGSNYSGNPAYYAFDGKDTTAWASNLKNTQDYIGFYNPNPLLVSEIVCTNKSWITGLWEVYGSNNNRDYELLASGENTDATDGSTFTIDLSSNEKPYKYYKIQCLTTLANQRVGMGEIKITAQELMDIIEVPSSSITDFGSYKYFKNIVTTKYWKEITTGSKELEYACYKSYLSGTTESSAFWGYIKIPIGHDNTYYSNARWGSTVVTSSSQLTAQSKDAYYWSNMTEDKLTLNVELMGWFTVNTVRYPDGDLYKDTTVTETVEGTPEDYTYTTEETETIEVTADDEYDFTEFVPSTQFDYYIDRNKMYQLASVERTYYKYVWEDWTQPVLTNNTSYGTITGSSYYSDGDDRNYYHISDGKIPTANNGSDSWGTNNSSTGWFLWKLPVKIKIKGIKIYNRFHSSAVDYQLTGARFYTDDTKTTPIGEEFSITTSGGVYELTTIPEEGIITDQIYFYKTGSSYSGIGELEITAQEFNVFELNVNGSDIYQDWKQPVLTANGTMGGDSFAVSSNVAQYSGQGVYKLFDGSTSDCFHSTSGVTTGYIDLYNPKPLKITNILVNNQNSGGSENRASTSGNIYGSSNGSDWEQITSYTNTVQGINELWNIDLSSNNKAYRYYRIESTAGGSGGYWTIGELTITAQELIAVGGTVEDADYYTSKILNYEPYAPRYEVISQMFSVSDELQTYVVPDGVDKLNVVCVGSRGGNSGGLGGRVICDLNVTAGQTLYVNVGGIPTSTYIASYNASDIRIDGTEYENRIIVAGGGGSMSSRGAAGGAGGGLTGGDGSGHGNAYKGYGGTQTAGGAGGSYAAIGQGHSHAGGDGTFGLGGNGASCGYCGQNGAGGAGWYGGGAGAAQWNKNGAFAAGGGGGSSYTDDTLCSNVVHAQGINSGEGYVKISYIKELRKWKL